MADETDQTDTTTSETETVETTDKTETVESGEDESNVNDTGKEGDAEKSLMDGGGKEEPDPATLPPEKYELAAPEGFTIDETVMAEADPIFRDIGLTNDQANKLMPLAGKFAERIAAQQNDAFQAMKTDWAKAAKKDPELGGANWSETENLVAKALDAFGAPKDSEFRSLLNETGLGNHPEMLRMFRKIGAQIGDGGELARSDTGAPTRKTREDVLYGAKEN